MANGMLSLGELKREIAAGTIDTVVAAMVDMQGRLIGKRFHAQFFADSGHEETHGCNYLLGVDIEMEPVPGYKATSWEKGYGDFVLKPDMATLRRVPWLPGTALVICDVLDHHTHEDVPHSPRAMLKKQLKRLEAMKLKAYVASELEFFLFDDSYDDRQPEGLSQPQDQRALHRGLPHPPDDQGRERDAGHPQRAPRRGHPGRELQGRMGPGPGGDQRPVCRGARDGRPARHHQERLQGDRLRPRTGRHLHGQVGLRHGRAAPATSTSRSGRRTARRRCSSTRRASTACRRR